MSGVPASANSRDDAERYILAELSVLANRLRAIEAERLGLYERRRELYNLGRALEPPVTGSAMAKAAGVSDAALVLSSGRKNTSNRIQRQRARDKAKQRKDHEGDE
jgi:hypothetical protein